MHEDDFADWLGSELESRGWSQAELARRVDVTHAAISFVITRRRAPSPQLCLSLAEVLDLPPAEVFRRAGLLPPIAEGAQRLAEIYTALEPDRQEILITVARALLQSDDSSEESEEPR